MEQLQCLRYLSLVVPHDRQPLWRQAQHLSPSGTPPLPTCLSSSFIALSSRSSSASDEREQNQESTLLCQCHCGRYTNLMHERSQSVRLARAPPDKWPICESSLGSILLAVLLSAHLLVPQTRLQSFRAPEFGCLTKFLCIKPFLLPSDRRHLRGSSFFRLLPSLVA